MAKRITKKMKCLKCKETAYLINPLSAGGFVTYGWRCENPECGRTWLNADEVKAFMTWNNQTDAKKHLYVKKKWGKRPNEVAEKKKKQVKEKKEKSI